MQRKPVGRRLLSALAGSTPAFTPTSTVEQPRTPSHRLLSALAGSSPAFSRGTPPDSFTLRPGTAPSVTNLTHSQSGDDSEARANTANRTANSKGSAALPPVARAIAALPPHERLVLRVSLPLRELAWVGNTALWCVDGLRIVDILDRDLVADNLARIRGRDLASGLARALDYARSHALNYDLNLDRAYFSARDLTAILAGALDLAHVRYFARVHALDLVRVLADALDRARVLERDRIAALVRALERDRKHSRDLAHGVVSARDLDYYQAMAEAVGMLIQAVTDVRGDDLTGIDLENLDLDGVRWSVTTRWPVGWADRIKQISVLIGPGEYEIRDTPHTDTNADAGVDALV